MSNYVMIKDTLKFSYPEGFHLMEKEELSKYNSVGEGPLEGLCDPERHVIISLGWRHVGGLISMLTSPKDIARGMQKQIGRAMKSYDFRPDGSLSRNVGGETAMGFVYEYEVQGIDMHGESSVLKHGKDLFYFHIYTRTESKDENLKMWDEMLSSAAWVK